jgi:hypothetical protein
LDDEERTLVLGALLEEVLAVPVTWCALGGCRFWRINVLAINRTGEQANDSTDAFVFRFCPPD